MPDAIGPQRVEIRYATTADAPALAALLIAVGWFGWMRDRPRNEVDDQVKRHLALALGQEARGTAAHSVYVADADGLVRGYLAVHWLPYLIRPGLEGFVSELFVHPDERGHGLGSRLLERLVADARERGCDRLSLLNSRSRESYERAFYTRNGWVERPDMANFIFSL
jgi:GNAT superfamily N-acetyltransferase